jgi:hypothetical protein
LKEIGNTGYKVRAVEWPEPVEIKRVDYGRDYVHIVGATVLSNHHIDH